MSLAIRRFHGTLRGLHAAGRSAQFEGRFGRLFRGLPPARFTPGELRLLAERMVAEEEEEQTPETEQDAEENVGSDPRTPAVSAGFTYLGQFIDHDLTFDPASSLERQNDPDALVDFRTPRFDLDSVYGRGPDDQPYLYEEDGVRMILGRPLTGNPSDPRARDLPRTSVSSGPRRALIGDPRNDENVIVAQLHAAFLRFHNRVADVLGPSAPFEDVQREVRWHYQWVVLNDFLPTIVEARTLHRVLPHLARGTSIAEVPPHLRFFRPRKRSFMPVEFSVAAYRFGHSMVRPEYRINENTPPEENGPRIPIFADTPPSLVGFGEFPSNLAIDWRLFFALAPAPPSGKGRIQPAYKIDSSLVNPLGSLPAAIAADPSSLAERNLLRGLSMGLPSGQAVARAMGVRPIRDEELRVGKATEEDAGSNPRLVEICPGFRRNAPLWTYVLAEAQHAFVDDRTPLRLGPVGGTIVAEVFAGLLLHDSTSFVRQDPCFRPRSEFMRNERFGMAELLLQALEA
jgi:heme peroxidase